MSDDKATAGPAGDESFFEEKDRILRRRKELDLDSRPEKTVGLALSGGGIRSATFSLGVLQGMAKTRSKDADSREDTSVLKMVDLLSTVSGGGYVGMFFGGLAMPRSKDKTIPDPINAPDGKPADTPQAALDRAIEILSTKANTPDIDLNPDEPKESDRATIFHPLHWLRENGRYLTPGGSGDTLYLLAFYLRSIIGVQYVFALALLLPVLLLLPVRQGTQWLLSRLMEATGYGQTWAAGLQWSGQDGGSTTVFWWSPILLWPVVLIALVAGPLILAYWVTYRQNRKSILSRTIEEWGIELGPIIAAIIATAVVWKYFDSSPSDPFLLLLAYAAYLGITAYAIRNLGIPLELKRSPDAKGFLDRFEWKSDTGKVATARLVLTKELANVLWATMLLAIAGLLDSIGQSLYGWLINGETTKWTSFTSGAGVVGVIAILFRKFSLMAGNKSAQGWIGLLLRYQRAAATAAGIILVFGAAIVLYVLVLTLLYGGVTFKHFHSFGSSGGPGWSQYGAITAAWALLFAMTWLSEGFLNNSTYHRFYAARLIRTFLGAANYKRMKELADAFKGKKETQVRALFVSEAHPDDDISLRSYYRTDKDGSLGPLHLVNVTINESLSLTSSLVREDRKSVPLCVGPEGIHAGALLFKWTEGLGDIGSRIQSPEPPATDTAIDSKTFPGDEEGDATSANDAIERLSLGSWCAISGAAASTGMGRLSGTGYSMLAWLFNARLGYWWRAPRSMSTQGRHSPLRTFDLVRQEFFARFYGRRGVLWNLSDGGHFENTGMYELIRRRVPFIICCDNGADPDYGFEDLENLIRRVRIDFGAEVEIFGDDQLPNVIKPTFSMSEMKFFDRIGSIDKFRKVDERGKFCMLLGKVAYDEKRGGGQSLVLIIKPSIVDFAPEDVRLYGRENSTFPQETTADQFFSEAQWESYRKLGEVIGVEVFSRWKYFRDLQNRI